MVTLESVVRIGRSLKIPKQRELPRMHMAAVQLGGPDEAILEIESPQVLFFVRKRQRRPRAFSEDR